MSLHEQYLFLGESIKNFKAIGSVTPSSKFLIQNMFKYIDFKHTKCIIELGAGTGNVTRALLKKLAPDAKLYSFEINKKFVNLLKTIRDSRLHIIQDSASKIHHYIKEKINLIISVLPLSSLPKRNAKQIILSVKHILHPDGQFIQVRYSPFRYRFLKNFFSHITLDYTFLNIPPSFVCVCSE